MLLMSVEHPDVFQFVNKKRDRTKVTGANISVMLTDKFMKAVENDADFVCSFPIGEHNIDPADIKQYNTLMNYLKGNEYIKVMKVKAREIFDQIVENAWDNAEPGVAFSDTVWNYSPDGVYPQYRATASNPCGEQWLQPYDACRLIAMNLFSCVRNPFTSEAYLDLDLVYKVAYAQQEIADNIVDLEIEYVTRIIDKINSDPEEDHVKQVELDLWKNIRETASNSRRTGCGFTGLADMLAALGLKYDSDEALEVVRKVSKEKMRAELDCTIDLAALKGCFKGYNSKLEFSEKQGLNSFFEMMLMEFPEQVERMKKFGRRNVSWSTVAPTGSLSIITKLIKYSNISAGIEPQFETYFLRNKKVNPGDENVRVDFVDQNGDSWMTLPSIMGGFKEWIRINHPKVDFLNPMNLDPTFIKELHKKSPYYKACANDISWEKRVRLQSIVQRYTTNAISSTLNLPENVDKSVIGNIYLEAWKLGLKGVTVYRDNCRTGVLVREVKSSFEYRDALKRPKEIDSDFYSVSVKGVKFGVVIGKIDSKPYEVFAFNLNGKDLPSELKGQTVKVKKGKYDFIYEGGKIENLQEAALHKEEMVLTRLVSGMLRHGAKPQFVMEQIDKCEMDVVSFGKALSRTLKKYCTERELTEKKTCDNCGSTDLKLQEGCLVCKSCGDSKCG